MIQRNETRSPWATSLTLATIDTIKSALWSHVQNTRENVKMNVFAIVEVKHTMA